MKPPIVFIHGLSMNPVCWDEWIRFFTERGFECHAPAFPFHEGEPFELRRHMDPQLRKMTFANVLERITDYIALLDRKPIVIGHSVGGLIVQKLLEENKAVGGISICSAPPPGIYTLQWSFLRCNFAMINPLKGNSLMLPDVKFFHYSVCNTMSLAEAAAAREKFVVPESRNISRTLQRVNFKECTHPLLFIAAEKDNITPAKLNMKNYIAYRNSPAKTEFKEFEGRSHFICWQNDWQHVAAYVASWIEKLLAIPKTHEVYDEADAYTVLI